MRRRTVRLKAQGRHVPSHVDVDVGHLGLEQVRWAPMPWGHVPRKPSRRPPTPHPHPRALMPCSPAGVVTASAGTAARCCLTGWCTARAPQALHVREVPVPEGCRLPVNKVWHMPLVQCTTSVADTVTS